MTDQHRYYGDAARERSLQLNAHEVVGILETFLTRLVAYVCPLRTNNRQDYRAAADDVVQVSAEILPQRNRIHILEHPRLAELGYKPVIDAAHGIGGVTAAIADEDAGQNATPHQPVDRTTSLSKPGQLLIVLASL